MIQNQFQAAKIGIIFYIAMIYNEKIDGRITTEGKRKCGLSSQRFQNAATCLSVSIWVVRL